MTAEFATVVLVEFPFADSATTKRRPALVLADAGDGDLLLARISTRPAASPSDVPVAHWQTAGLLAPSCIRLQKLATIHSGLIVRALGTLHDGDAATVARALTAFVQGMSR
ncbi:MAG: growth inhibitor [Anaerolinea sp.]|nr:growth inhibitor [Anaerolinea sp.]